MPLKLDIMEGINSAYKYVLKHTDLHPSEDLYQEVACYYIQYRNADKPHGQCLSTVLNKYKKPKKQITEIDLGDLLEFVPDYHTSEEFITEKIFEDQLEKALNNVLCSITEKERDILYKRYSLCMTFSEIGETLNRSNSRVIQIHDKSIRKLRHPSRSRILREFYINL